MLKRAVPFVALASLVPHLAFAQQQQPNPYAPPQTAPVYPQPQYVVQPVYVQQPAVYAPPRTPKVIRDYEEGAPVPPGYHPEQRVRIGLAAGGGSLFLATYLITILGAAVAIELDKSQTGTSDAVLFVPVAGPFIRTANNDALASVGLVIDGLAQLGGVVMFAVGMAAQKTVLVRNDIGKSRVLPSPMLVPGGAGLAVTGAF